MKRLIEEIEEIKIERPCMKCGNEVKEEGYAVSGLCTKCHNKSVKESEKGLEDMITEGDLKAVEEEIKEEIELEEEEHRTKGAGDRGQRTRPKGLKYKTKSSFNIK